MDYIKRIVDKEIDRKKQAFNAVNIVGPKGCGKSRTAKEHCKTVIEFQDEAGTIYKEPAALVIICATVPMAYTTKNGVKVIPVGCLRE